MPLRVDLLSDAPDEKTAVAAIADKLSDPGVTKYVYDSKSVMARLAENGAALSGCEDVALMEYLAKPNFKYSSAEGFAETLGLNADSSAAALVQGGKALLDFLDRQNMTELYRGMELAACRRAVRYAEDGFSARP